MRMISVSGFGWEGREECLKRGQLMAADWWDSLLEESWKTSLPVLDFWADWEKSSHLPGFQFLIYKRWWKSLGWIPLRKGKERKVKSLSHVRLFTTPWTVAYQAPLSMGFSRQEYWHGLPLPFSIATSNCLWRVLWPKKKKKNKLSIFLSSPQHIFSVLVSLTMCVCLTNGNQLYAWHPSPPNI